MGSGKFSDDLSVTRDHRRQWRDCLYVYPVVSRRAQGLSIGINLNLDKQCNFACVYCQINRGVRRGGAAVDLGQLRGELQLALGEALSGRLWLEGRFSETPAELRRINDIAFSGDGEPTCLQEFDQAVRVAAEVKAGAEAQVVKLVVITNATQLGSEQFLRAVPILQESNGEIWAKLDAGTEELFQKINRPSEAVTLDQICRNIAAVAGQVPVVIQTLLFCTDGAAPRGEHVGAYCARVRNIFDAGAPIRLIQLHTIARPPAEANVSALTDGQLDAIAAAARAALPEIEIAVTYGADVPPQ